MADLEEALRLIAANPSRAFFHGPRDAALVASAERAFGDNLPPTYREFVTKLGAGNFGGFEVYGVTDEKFEDSTIPNGVWVTLNQRREIGLPAKLVIVGNDGTGDYYCVEMRGGGESPVTVYQPGWPLDQQQWEQVAQDFGAFLLDGVRDEL
ncbi:MAG TPA: SMI1/KNR4 family protein [Xanthobacteraceae bacterium]|nr:SMI1/KNR4 family protein [Xanthobacteraceae bacterium]